MIGCIIQARMCSTRLKGKVLHKINSEETILSFLLKQITNCKSLKTVVVATTELDEDDVIVDFLKSYDVEIFRGNSENVLDRFYHCAKKFKFSTIVRLTADNPLIDPQIVNDSIQKYSNSDCDYLTNSIDRTFPNGTEVEIFSFNALETAWKFAKKKSEREHVTPYFYNNPNKFKIHHFKQKQDQSKFRYSIDRKEDYLLVLKILSKINTRPIKTSDIIELLTNYPEIKKLNSHIIPNEGYVKSISED
jgi:spore coat polysaccharide biosynthesis protein SpsF